MLPLFFLRFTLACIPGSFKDDRNITSKSYDLHTKIERENVKFDKESLPKKDAWTVWIITKHSKEKKNIFAYVIWNKQKTSMCKGVCT